MVGIDIADNASFASNFLKRPQRFMAKIFTSIEQSTILDSTSPEKTALLFWTMKESAWKAHFPQSKKRTFNPKAYSCEISSNSGDNWNCSGIVRVDGIKYYTLSKVDSSSTLSIAANNLNQVYASHGIVSTTNVAVQSSYVHNQLIVKLGECFKIEQSTIRIEKDELGVPVAFSSGERLPVSISISHHSRFVAFAIHYENN